MIPSNNPDYLFIGSGEFAFSEGAKNPGQAQALGWRDIGNIKVFNLDPGGDTKEHTGNYRGTTRRDRLKRVNLKIGYKLTCDEFNATTLPLLFTASLGGYTSQAAVGAAPGAALAFSVGQPSQASRFYDVLAADGSRLRDLAAVTVAGKVEGTDFEVDLKLGRIRFLLPQTAPLTPAVTAPQIVAGSAGSLRRMTPMQVGLREGLGRISVFEEGTEGIPKMLFVHENFGCTVSIDGGSDLKADDWSDLSVMVAVTNPVGEIGAGHGA